MITILKKIGKYLLFLIPWFLGSLFSMDTNFYKSLDLPFFAPPSVVFPIVWSILFILIAYSIYLVWDKKDKTYLIYLIINYVSNVLYTFFFFTLKSPGLALLDTIVVFYSAVKLYDSTKKIDNNAAKKLIPYLIWSIFALILSITIVILN